MKIEVCENNMYRPILR